MRVEENVGIEDEIALLMQLLDSVDTVAGEVAETELVRDEVAEAAPRERYKVMGPALTKVAAASVATLPAVLTPVPAFAGTPLPPNLMLAMAARPAAPLPDGVAGAQRRHGGLDVPPALAATGPQLFPFTRPMQTVRTSAAQLPVEMRDVAAPKFSMNPRLRSIFSEQRKVAITTKRQLAATFYRVRPGDSLYSIASQLLGAGSRWREIYEANQAKIGPNYLLLPGQQLTVAVSRPATTPAVAAKPAAIAAKPKAYVVAPGDNLYTIAAKQLGNPSRWKEIVSLNKAALNGKTVIYPNQWLTLPSSV